MINVRYIRSVALKAERRPMSDIKSINYKYNNAPILGGGYVTGFVFHSKEPGCMYIRTDIGGVYRYNNRIDIFDSLGDHIRQDNLAESFPIAVALDEKIPSRLYVVCGMERNHFGTFCFSTDRGNTFIYKTSNPG